MQLAIDCAGFSPAEADRLRQAMGSKRALERIEELRERLLAGMAERGIPGEVAEDIYAKILAFSSYGFPESHAISFAYLVYASAWLKCYYPAAFTAALLRAQPMGFYSPASLVGDARRHGVQVRGVDVNASADPGHAGDPMPSDQTRAAPRPGRQPRGPDAAGAGAGAVRRPPGAGAAGHPARPGRGPEPGRRGRGRIVAGQPYADLEDFARRTGLPAAALEALAMAGAFGCFGLSRRQALWAAGAAATIGPGQLPGTAAGLAAPPLPAMTAAQETFADLWATGTSGDPPDRAHPGSWLAPSGVLTAARAGGPPGRRGVGWRGWSPTGSGRGRRAGWCS